MLALMIVKGASKVPPMHAKGIALHPQGIPKVSNVCPHIYIQLMCVCGQCLCRLAIRVIVWYTIGIPHFMTTNASMDLGTSHTRGQDVHALCIFYAMSLPGVA